MKKLVLLWFWAAVFIGLISPIPTFAHAFGQLYTLPLPIWLYLYGGGAAVLISFIAVGIFARERTHSLNYKQGNITPYLQPIINNSTFFILQIISVIILCLSILSGLLGTQTAVFSLTANIFWIVLILGFSYLSAFIGNFWHKLNPWKILIDIVDKDNPALIKYPTHFGYIPALFFYFCLIWLELVSGGIGSDPYTLSIILIIYTLITFVCVFLFGEEVWFEYGDFFSVFLGLISKISIFERKNNKIIVRPPFVGLLNQKSQHFSLLIFILFMLSSTAYDGFRGTSVWVSLYLNYISPLETSLGYFGYQIIQTILLASSPILFLALYLIAVFMMKLLIKVKFSIKELALIFAPSLVPIALAYNVAHYYTLVLIQGQTLIPLASDPLNQGWNLFGTSGYIINIAVINANFVWNTEVAAIVIGHIAAVYLAHILALKTFPSHKQAVLSQLPILALMIAYTVTGLWILAQPLTGTG